MAEAWHESLRNSARNSQYNGWGALKAAAAAERNADEAVRTPPLEGNFVMMMVLICSVIRWESFVIPTQPILVQSPRLASPLVRMGHNQIHQLLQYPLKLYSLHHRRVFLVKLETIDKQLSYLKACPSPPSNISNLPYLSVHKSSLRRTRVAYSTATCMPPCLDQIRSSPGKVQRPLTM